MAGIPYLLYFFTWAFFFGLYLFFKGFITYRKYLLLTGIPKAAIRSVPMGLVHIRGKAKWDEAQASPVGGAPCLFYRVETYKAKKFSLGQFRSPPRESWKRIETDVSPRLFYIEDETGKILVDAREAEIRQEDSKDEDRLFNEIHDYPYQYGCSPLDLSLKRMSVLWHSSLPDSVKQARTGEIEKLGGSSGTFLMKEWWIQPGQEYTVIGTCIEIPPNKDGVQKMMVKGANDPRFSVNSMDERLREKMMHGDAVASIWGGGIIAVGSLGVLMNSIRAIIAAFFRGA